MVKVQERSLEERTNEENCNRLLELTRKTIGGSRSIERFGRYAFYIDGSTHVNTINYFVYVKM